MNSIIYDDFQDWLYNPHNPINSVHQGGFPNIGGPPMISPPHSLPPQARESMDTSEPMQVSTTGDTYMDCDSSEVGQTRSNVHIYMHACYRWLLILDRYQQHIVIMFIIYPTIQCFIAVLNYLWVFFFSCIRNCYFSSIYRDCSLIQ